MSYIRPVEITSPPTTLCNTALIMHITVLLVIIDASGGCSQPAVFHMDAILDTTCHIYATSVEVLPAGWPQQGSLIQVVIDSLNPAGPDIVSP
jgi:hypothetical protein